MITREHLAERLNYVTEVPAMPIGCIYLCEGHSERAIDHLSIERLNSSPQTHMHTTIAVPLTSSAASSPVPNERT